jgi:hypothetical protein
MARSGQVRLAEETAHAKTVRPRAEKTPKGAATSRWPRRLFVSAPSASLGCGPGVVFQLEQGELPSLPCARDLSLLLSWAEQQLRVNLVGAPLMLPRPDFLR